MPTSLTNTAKSQMRKIDGGLRALAAWVEQSKDGYLVQSRLTYADIAVCSVLGFMNVRWPHHSWASLHDLET
jgi:glutathione S-transferase